MRTRSILAAVFGLLIPSLLAAQTSPDVDVSGTVLAAPQAIDHPADTFDSHVVKRGTTVWFGKSKNKILDYAAVTTKTGIEGSSTAYLGSQKVIAATIATTLNATAAWTLHFETSVDIGKSAWQRQGRLVSDDRSIDIIDNRSPLGDTKPVSGFGIEFIENGRLLAAVGDGVYLFNSHLDPDLRLVLAAAMEVVNFRHMQ